MNVCAALRSVRYSLSSPCLLSSISLHNFHLSIVVSCLLDSMIDRLECDETFCELCTLIRLKGTCSSRTRTNEVKIGYLGNPEMLTFCVLDSRSGASRFCLHKSLQGFRYPLAACISSITCKPREVAHSIKPDILRPARCALVMNVLEKAHDLDRSSTYSHTSKHPRSTVPHHAMVSLAYAKSVCKHQCYGSGS